MTPPGNVTECSVEWYRVPPRTNSPNLIGNCEVVPHGRMISSPTSMLIPKLYVFVGRGHDPADQVPMTTPVPFNGSISELSRCGGVMTPPYES